MQVELFDFLENFLVKLEKKTKIHIQNKNIFFNTK